ncbi:MAG: hypothetical protein LBM00_08505 [Deltaproteobacteria bacterium]|jgi:hypothetical protein|nr:hypothetical protein [Deltaproteobacteria bacterium]
MSTFLGLAGVIVVCGLLMDIFQPSYGVFRCCTGQALQSAMEDEEKKKKLREAENCACPEQGSTHGDN